MGSPFTTTAPSTLVARPASDAARSYLHDLMLEKALKSGVPADQAILKIAPWIERHADKDTVSANIDRLKAEGFTGRAYQTAAPTPSADRPSADVVPAGRYAIDTEDGAVNATAFYKVDRPTEGRWAGYVFVKLMLSDEEQRMSRAAGDAVLRKIAAVGAAAASARYGHEIGECGVCGRTLTNDVSREYGIGPDCRKKMDW